MPTWLRTALQYAPLAERAGRWLAGTWRRLRGREAPSLKDAREANERAAWDLPDDDWSDELKKVTPTETPLSKLREPCGFCGHARGAHGLGRNIAACSLCMCRWFS